MKQMICLTIVILLLTTQIYAIRASEEESKLTNALPNSAKSLMSDYDFNDASSFGSQIKRIFQEAWSSCKKQFPASIRCATRMVLIVLICATLGALFQNNIQSALALCGAACILILCADDLKGIMASANETLIDVHAFSKLLFPVMAGACFTAGLPTASAALYAGTMFFMQALLVLLEKILLPFVYAFVALAGADAALDSDTLKRIRIFIGNGIKNALKVIMFLFSGYLLITGLITGQTDALALKATKLTVSTAVPVVGGMVSDASETILVGAKTILHSAGIFGMLGALSILVVPFIKIGFQYLVLQIATAISSLFGLKSHIQLMDAVSAAMGYLLAITSCSTLMTFISCFCFIRVVSV